MSLILDRCKQHLPTKKDYQQCHTNTPPSGQSSLRSIFNAIIHMRHTTYSLQNTHAIETEPHTHTHTHTHTCHRQVNLLSDRSSTQSFTCATRLTDCKIHTQSKQSNTHTHMPPSGQSPLRSIFNAIIHMRHTTYPLQNANAIEGKRHTHTLKGPHLNHAVCRCSQHT